MATGPGVPLPPRGEGLWVPGLPSPLLGQRPSAASRGASCDPLSTQLSLVTPTGPVHLGSGASSAWEPFPEAGTHGEH